MPTYEYRCSACEHRWEEFQSMTADPTKKCPECGKNKAERMISAGGGIIFRGSGFYQTDYRSESYKKGASAESKASESKSSDAAKSDSSSSGSSGKSDGGSASSTKSTASSE
ncbi:MAG: zinc ribbon domain-containing protein [Planctomycetaceae bacterium]|nr:zinc ribbon domain-containing protein [Planctomycetaceae bacterium]